MRTFLLIAASFLSFTLETPEHWITQKHKGYTLNFTAADQSNIQRYSPLFDAGVAASKTFFNTDYSTSFDIFVHPGRHSLDSTWQKDWSMPDFKSECWMVASGTAKKLDIISPVRWDSDACEHVYSEAAKTQQLITHELVHVFHGQRNASSDFSDVEGIDWFVEGLATYASGQCDKERMAEVRKLVSDKKAPARLDDFWKGKSKYGLSGSVVMYIDNKYGRAKLIELLKYNKKVDILSTFKTTEEELLDGWSNYVQR